MTYIFLSVGIAAKNHLAPLDIEFYKLMITDGVILLIAAIAEKLLFRAPGIVKTVIYDNLENIHPGKKEALLSDLQQRFGISDVQKVTIEKIDAPKSAVTMNVEFIPSENSNFG